MTDPTFPDATGSKIERKVTVAAFGTYVGSLAALAVLNGVADTNLISELPDWAEIIFAPLVPRSSPSSPATPRDTCRAPGPRGCVAWRALCVSTT